MKRVLFIYNPNSGHKNIKKYLDEIIQIHQQHNKFLELIAVGRNIEFDKLFKDIKCNEKRYEYILVAGGDGTVDGIVNLIKRNEINIPLAIIPSGTANDFAKCFGMKTDVIDACNQIVTGVVESVDIGKINESYFVNVASFGVFTDISQKTSLEMKTAFGKMAYYIRALEDLPKVKKIKIKVKSESIELTDDIYMMTVFNGKTAGNLNLAYKSSVDDGLLDIIIINSKGPKETVELAYKMLKTEHLDSDNGIIYFRASELIVECEDRIVTDIDGEQGPDFPLHIKCERRGLKVIVPIEGMVSADLLE